MPLIILRGEDTIYTSVTPGMDGKIGVELIDYYLGPSEYQAYGFFDSFVQSITNIGQYTGLTFVMLKNVIVGDIKFNQAFGGPVKIAKFAAKSADSGMVSFLYFLAMLSLSLAIINILPFPVLDGGHIVIICIEGVIRKELPIKVKIVIQNTGFALLLLLMVFVIYNDIISL
jgi:regulator of sigma E protease